VAKNSLPACTGVTGRSTALLVAGLLGACSSWLPDSATQQNQTVLYGEFYEANLGNDAERADHLARKLELCGRQLYVKDKGFLTALKQRDGQDTDTSIGDMVDLFTEDACAIPDDATPPAKAGDGSDLDTSAAPDAAANRVIEAGATE